MPTRVSTPTTLAERVRLARRKAGLSQEALAARLGIRRAAITQWEHPEGTQPSMVNLRQAACEMRVAFEWLATGRGAMHPEVEEVPAFAMDCIARGADEEALLAYYRALSGRQREALSMFLRALGRK